MRMKNLLSACRDVRGKLLDRAIFLLLAGLLAVFLGPVSAFAVVSEQMTITGLYQNKAGEGEPLDLAYGPTSQNSDPNTIVLADDSVAVPTIKFYKNASNEWETATYVAGFRCCYLDDSLTHKGTGNIEYGSPGVVFPNGTDDPDTACDYLYFLTPVKKNNKLQWTAQPYTASDGGEQTLELKDADNNPIVEITSNAVHVKSAYGANENGVWESDGKQYHVVYSKFTPKNAGTLTVCIRGIEFKHGGYATPYYFVNIEVVDEQAPSEPEVTYIDVPTAKTGLVYNGAEQRGVSVGEGYDLENVTATDAGTYQAVAKLREGFAWNGDLTGDQTIEWSIEQAQLQATYKSETVRPDETPAYAVTYSGWKGSDGADNAADFVAPTVTGPESLSVNTEHSLKPEGGSAKNYYFTYWPGTLTVLKHIASLTAGDNVANLQNDLVVGGEAVSVDVSYAGRQNATAEDALIYSYTRQAANIVSYDSSSILEASYDPATEKLTVTPLGVGECMLKIVVDGDDAYDEAQSSYINVSISEVELQDAALTFEDDYENKLVALKAGDDPVDIGLVYSGRSDVAQTDVTIEPNSSDVASVSYDIAAGKLTVEPKAAGTADFTVTVAGGDSYNDAKQTINLSVSAADEDQPTEGGDDNPQAKNTIALEPMTVAAGASKSGNIAIKDADGNTVESGIVVASSNDAIATAKYEGGTLTVTGVAEGTATITLSSAALDDDYSIAVSVTGQQSSAGDSSSGNGDASGDGSNNGTGENGTAGDSGNGGDGSGNAAANPVVTVTDASKDGVKVDYSGLELANTSDISIVVNGVSSDSDAYKQLKDKATGSLLAVYTVKMTVDGEEVHDGFGTLKISFPVDSAYEGKEVIVAHLHRDGTLTNEKATVTNGFATVAVTDLSEFSVQSGTSTPATANNTNAGTKNTTNSGNTSQGSNLAKTGDDSMTLVWGGLAVIVVAGIAGSVLAIRGRREDKPDNGKAA